jgi:hypothetical protein
MSDIFLSYASEDRSIAKRIATLLEQHGWHVWWDRSIPIGMTFDEVIERALEETRCVVVLWSQVSIGSRWVKTEAAEGARRGILIPLIMEEVVPPLEFRRVQAADLNGWGGESDHPGVAQFIGAVAALLARKPEGTGDRTFGRQDLHDRESGLGDIAIPRGSRRSWGEAAGVILGAAIGVALAWAAVFTAVRGTAALQDGAAAGAVAGLLAGTMLAARRAIDA